MITLSTYKKWPIGQIAAMLLLMLFVYSATSKLFEFDKFSQEMSLSPFFSKLPVRLIAIAVLVVELGIGMLFFFPKTKNAAFLASLVLLNGFTVYIYLLLGSEFIPCSCGGILGKMDWSIHIIFNLICMLIAVLGYIYNYAEKE